MMPLHKWSAGDGYAYLMRQVAAEDADHPGRLSLADYHPSKEEFAGSLDGSM